MAGTAMGIVNLFPFAGGAVFQPLLGFILERNATAEGTFSVLAYQQAFMVLFAAGIIAFIASLFLKESMVTES
jgi:O-antigen ligase